MFDKSQPEFWRKIEPGYHFVLSDWRSMQDSRGTGSVGSMTYRTKSVLHVRETGNLGEWIFIKLSSSKRYVTLVAKLVDDTVDLKLFSLALAAGNRREAAEGFPFLFEDFAAGADILSVPFAKAIEHTLVDEEGRTTVLLFVRKQLELTGWCEMSPALSGVRNLLATVSEYGSTTECAEPELLILELGSADNSDGGLVEMYQGAPLLDSRIEVLEVPS